MLKAQVWILLQPDEDPFKIAESDVEDASDPNQIIDSDDEGNETLKLHCIYKVTKKLCSSYVLYYFIVYNKLSIPSTFLLYSLYIPLSVLPVFAIRATLE